MTVTYVLDMPTPDEISSVMQHLGAKGGRARAESMTAEERSESARRAVLKRWERREEGEGQGKKKKPSQGKRKAGKRT